MPPMISTKSGPTLPRVPENGTAHAGPGTLSVPPSLCMHVFVYLLLIIIIPSISMFLK